MSTSLCVKTLQAAAQRKSMNECSEVKKTSTDFPARGLGSNEQRVGIISIGTQFMHVALF